MLARASGVCSSDVAGVPPNVTLPCLHICAMATRSIFWEDFLKNWYISERSDFLSICSTGTPNVLANRVLKEYGVRC